MTFDEIRKTLEKEFNDQWSETEVCWENVPINVPNEHWVRFVILFTKTSNFNLGTRTEKSGLIILQIFGPKNLGTGRHYQLIDTFNNLFENKRFPGLDLFTYASSPEIIGESPTTSFNPGGSGQFRQLVSGFYLINVKIPFKAF